MKYFILIFSIMIIAPSYASETQHTKRHIKPIEIHDAWARATLPAMRASAAYMVIKNNTDKEDCLIKAEAKTISEYTSLHSTTEDENGTLSMVHVDDMCIPAHSEASLKPGKFHIMFMRLTKQLKLGNEVPLSLTFKNAGVIRARAEIKSLGFKGNTMKHNNENN